MHEIITCTNDNDTLVLEFLDSVDGQTVPIRFPLGDYPRVCKLIKRAAAIAQMQKRQEMDVKRGRKAKANR